MKNFKKKEEEENISYFSSHIARSLQVREGGRQER